MHTNAAVLAARYARRPLLLTPDAARELAMRLRAVDERAFARPSRLEALLRKLSGARASGARTDPARAMDDAEDYTPTPPEQRLAYAPLWAGEIEDVGFCWTLCQGVALMNVDTPIAARGEEICGVLYHGYDTILAGMAEAMADERVKALFVRLATPGGVVDGGMAALAKFMRENRAAAGGKPIWIYADMACSAGFWVASGGDVIWGPRVGLVGSVGVVYVHEDWSGAYAKEGVVVTPVTFGAKKVDANSWQALSPTAKADLQAWVDQIGRDFVADVVAGRPQLSAEAVIATEAAVYMVEHDEPTLSGVALGLADRVGSEQEAFAALLAEIGEPSASAPAPKGNSRPSAAASGAATAGTSVQPSKETPMSTSASRSPLAAGAAALALAAASPANAASPLLASASAAVMSAAASAGGEGDGETEETAGAIEPDYVDPDHDGDVDPPAPAGDGEGGDDKDDPQDARPEAVKISTSPEATAHPAQAHAAIASGMTYAQFKSQVEALAAEPKASALDRAMAGAARLGPDASAGAQKGGTTPGEMLVERARAMGAAPNKRR